ncbi:TonB-dependent siderophore receptor [Acinetobacter sp. B10A]|nr:TonB-dependent siderophore receptor [Acinetobacter baretiae]MBF7684732.1 TonB-dependent siderophore receptor [Acinetobacter baretiae]
MITLYTRSLPVFKISLLALLITQINQVSAQEIDSSTTATLDTIKIEAMSELDPIKSYVDYKEANVTRNGLTKKDIPQTVDTIDVQKYKVYGSNDLSVMLQGTPGVSTSYDMRGDGITIRGFNADTGDIYRDGIREGGQVRRSTSSVERIEILKGPASVLYGRSAGGGVVNMVSKYANFDSKSTIGVYAGSWSNLGTVIDLNHVINDQWAVRLNSEYGEADSFRRGINSRQVMASPSVTYRNDDQTLTWTTQYTYDNLHRIPDRGPYAYNLPKGTSIKQSYAQDGDFVEDTLQVARTDLKYEYAPNWNFHWALSYRVAEQNFDHFYLGALCTSNTTVSNGESDQRYLANGRNNSAYVAPEKRRCNNNVGKVSQIYYWQKAKNTTTSNTFDITGVFNTGDIKHNVMFGADWTYEQREPLLANTNQNNSLIYGFVNPLTGEKSNSRGSGNLKLNTHNYNQATGLGIFLQDLISFNEQFKLMLGGRYDTYESSTSNKLLAKNNLNYKRTVNNESFSPNVGLIYQPNEHHSIYASYSKSFSPFGGSAGVNAVSASQDLALFNAEPQYNIQYEVGVKSDWLNNRLNTQLSVYDIRKNNIRYRPDPTNKPDLWAVAGRHESKGVELSFIGRLIDNVFVRGGYGYTDAKVTADSQTPSNVNKRLALTSKNTGNLFFRYLPSESVYLETGVTYVGSFYNNLNNDYKVKGFSRLDAAVGYSQAPWNVTVAVGNVTNKKYWRSADLPGTPRSVLMRVNYQF